MHQTEQTALFTASERQTMEWLALVYSSTSCIIVLVQWYKIRIFILVQLYILYYCISTMV